MEDISPQSVGREFVRQYYTMLNERPDSLHRFFSQNSSYVHGGIEKPGEEQPPVRGQPEIHQKIMSLGFKDCHAKIRQVDCQETVGNGVLIQVTGELSNDSGPMRRFMQTFVLARQAAKTFYVHNDIFRYQDEVFHEFDGAVLSSELHVQPEEEAESVPSNSHVDHGAGTDADYEETRSVSPTVEEQRVEVAVMSEIEPAVVETEVAPAEKVPVDAVPAEPVDVVPAVVDEEGEPKQETAPTATPTKQEPAAEQLPVQKPFSWASLASKSATPSGGTTGTVAAAPKPQAAIKPERKVDSTITPQPLAQRPPRQTGRPSVEHTITDNNGETRKWPAYEGEEKPQGPMVPDNQQLFVGNLPHNVDDKELIEFFTKFGTVVDVKINRKGMDKNLPNFGFVSFDSPDAVGKTLASKPLLLYNKHRLNVEEKKEQSELVGRPRGGGRGGRGMGPYRGPYRGRGGHFSANQQPPVAPTTSRQDNGTYNNR